MLIGETLVLEVTLCVSEGSVGFAVFAYRRLRGFCLQVVVIGLGFYFGKGLLIEEELFLKVELCVSEGSVSLAVFACSPSSWFLFASGCYRLGCLLRQRRICFEEPFVLQILQGRRRSWDAVVFAVWTEL